MKVRSVNELKSLDDELDLFSEQDWDFLSVVDNHDSNFEYFNDIRDTDFDKRNKFNFKDNIFSIASLVAVLGICIIIAFKFSGIFDTSDYNSVLNIASVTQASSISYETGEDISSEDFLLISGVANNYFNCLQAESDYASLYDYCSVTSTFADTYYSATNKVETLYDKNDCYARVLREFGGFCSLTKVNNVVFKDNTYYCYMNVTIPTSSDIYEYVQMYSYNFTKEFNTYLPTEASIVKYFLELTRDNKIPCTNTEICLKFVKVDGNFKLVDDSFITSTCVGDYTSAVNQISNVLGSTLTNE